MSSTPSQGEVWLVDLDPVVGHEEGKKPRPAVVISDDTLNHGPLQMVIIVPLTRTRTGFPYHILIERKVGEDLVQSYVMCEQVRSISTKRLKRFLGDTVTRELLTQISARLRPLLPA